MQLRYEVKTNLFSNIPGSPIAYWASMKTVECFSSEKLGTIFATREGMATADNDRFLRCWYEVRLSSVSFNCANEKDALIRKAKWVPYNKGGGTWFWYGNNDYVVNWENGGYQIKNNYDPKTGRLRSHNYNGEYGFLTGITWSAISSGKLSVRFAEQGFLFDSKGAKGFCKSLSSLKWVLGLLNSKVSMVFLEFLSPTLDFKVGDIIQIPYMHEDSKDKRIIDNVELIINGAKNDWDSFETSWEFKKHPLI